MKLLWREGLKTVTGRSQNMHLGRGVSTELTVINALVYSKYIVSVADVIIAHACNSYIYFFVVFSSK